jgi:hypothetical protein
MFKRENIWAITERETTAVRDMMNMEEGEAGDERGTAIATTTTGRTGDVRGGGVRWID